MPGQKLIDRFDVLNSDLNKKKVELAAKIKPLVQEFMNETELLVRSIEPSYIDITTMQDGHRQFVVDSAKVYTDVDVRGIRERKVG